jgi:hypothetical protein
MDRSPVTSSLPLLPLEQFTEAAKTDQALYVLVDGENRQVLGRGSLPDGRSAAWLAPDLDATSMFTQALAQTYGPNVAQVVARQLGLESQPGQPLAARVVRAAVEMADTAMTALSGVDFYSRLSASAVANTPVFQNACRECSLDPSAISQERRHQLDLAMQTRFDKAAAEGQTPVSLATAGQWLRELLKQGA